VVGSEGGGAAWERRTSCKSFYVSCSTARGAFEVHIGTGAQYYLYADCSMERRAGWKWVCVFRAVQCQGWLKYTWEQGRSTTCIQITGWKDGQVEVGLCLWCSTMPGMVEVHMGAGRSTTCMQIAEWKDGQVGSRSVSFVQYSARDG
jgi:hypothetical protein